MQVPAASRSSGDGGKQPPPLRLRRSPDTTACETAASFRMTSLPPTAAAGDAAACAASQRSGASAPQAQPDNGAPGTSQPARSADVGPPQTEAQTAGVPRAARDGYGEEYAAPAEAAAPLSLLEAFAAMLAALGRPIDSAAAVRPAVMCGLPVGSLRPLPPAHALTGHRRFTGNGVTEACAANHGKAP